MTRPTAAELEQLIATAEKWLRRCNGKPAEGIPVSGAQLRAVLDTSPGVRFDRQGRIAWRGDGRAFTAEPVHDAPPDDDRTTA